VSPGSTSNAQLPTTLVDTVRAGAAGYDWAAAVVGRQAADLQLDSGAPVWSLGGYNGTDPHPTRAEFAAAVARHRVHYLVVSARSTAGTTEAARIARWATRGLPAPRLGGWRLIDLSGDPAEDLLSALAGGAPTGVPVAPRAAP
jgi:hypothetical protein